jgi:hypothetical protein
VNLWNNPKMGYDNCLSLYNVYDRNSRERFYIVSFVKKKKEKITDSPYDELF